MLYGGHSAWLRIAGRRRPPLGPGAGIQSYFAGFRLKRVHLKGQIPLYRGASARDHSLTLSSWGGVPKEMDRVVGFRNASHQLW